MGFIIWALIGIFSIIFYLVASYFLEKAKAVPAKMFPDVITLGFVGQVAGVVGVGACIGPFAICFALGLMIYEYDIGKIVIYSRKKKEN